MLFLVDKAPRNQQRKRDVLVPGSLETPIQRLLHVFPQRPAVRPHDHATAHRRIVRKLRFQDQLVVPLGKILCAGREFFFSHAAFRPFFSGEKNHRKQTQKRSGRIATCQRTVAVSISGSACRTYAFSVVPQTCHCSWGRWARRLRLDDTDIYRSVYSSPLVSHLIWIESNSISNINVALGPIGAPGPAPRAP